MRIMSILKAGMIMLSIAACNNGNYDANPNKNNSNVPNPIGPNAVITGNIRAEINGSEINFGSAFYEDGLAYRSLIGYADRRHLSIHINGYDSARTYKFDGGKNAGGIFYVVEKDANSSDSEAISVYRSITNNPGKEYAVVNVGLEENGEIKGMFHGVLYRLKKDSVIDLSDSIVITNGKFSVSKK